MFADQAEFSLSLSFPTLFLFLSLSIYLPIYINCSFLYF